MVVLSYASFALVEIKLKVLRGQLRNRLLLLLLIQLSDLLQRHWFAIDLRVALARLQRVARVARRQLDG